LRRVCDLVDAAKTKSSIAAGPVGLIVDAGLTQADGRSAVLSEEGRSDLVTGRVRPDLLFGSAGPRARHVATLIEARGISGPEESVAILGRDGEAAWEFAAEIVRQNQVGE